MAIIRPTLNLVAVPGLQPPIGTFTRASTATRVNSVGLIESVASGILRGDYDPVTGGYKGWLIEESRTNLLTYSEQFDNAAWTKTRASISANAAVAPDGTTTADKLVEDTTASNTHFVTSSTATIINGASYTGSIFVKPAERTYVKIQLGNGLNNAFAIFNLSTGSFVSSGNNPDSYSISGLGDGWYRLSVTDTSASTSGSLLVIMCDGSGNAVYTGDGTSGLYVWGAQLEAGAFPTSYIPTTTATVTRAADVWTIPTSAFGFNASEGTLFANYNQQYTPAASTYQYISALSDGTTSNRHYLYLQSNGSLGPITVTSGSSVVSPTVSKAVGRYKIAYGYKLDDCAGYADAVLIGADTSAAMPSGLTTLNLGSRQDNAMQLNGHIRHIAYFPRRLTNADLQTLTS